MDNHSERHSNQVRDITGKDLGVVLVIDNKSVVDSFYSASRLAAKVSPNF